MEVARRTLFPQIGLRLVRASWGVKEEEAQRQHRTVLVRDSVVEEAGARTSRHPQVEEEL